MATVSFKSRRAKSADPALPAAPPGDDAAAPLPAYAGALATIWQTILRVPAVAPEDDFFELGGSSLQAMLMAARIEDATGGQLSLTDFFDNPTFRGLCGSVTAP